MSYATPTLIVWSRRLITAFLVVALFTWLSALPWVPFSLTKMELTERLGAIALLLGTATPAAVVAIILRLLSRYVERRLEKLAFYDPLTGLANRALLADRLRQALARARRRQGVVTVMFLDLDGFKVVNDSLGHEAGDELLVAFGQRIQGALRAEDTVARFGGDEFTVLLQLTNSKDPLPVIERVRQALRAPVMIRGQEILLTASIGIACSRPESDASEMLRDADTAMYRAKAKGNGQYVVFERRMQIQSHNELDLTQDLFKAVERGEMRLYYQPEVNALNGKVIGVEALVRWQHPTRGLLLPRQFLTLAEQNGLMAAIGDWVLEEACTTARRWLEGNAKARSLEIGVNVSPSQLQGTNFSGHVASILRRTGLSPHALRLEITEGSLLPQSPAVVATLENLSRLGVALVIDDFGTGYASLGYLCRLPFKGLKIDYTFIKDLHRDGRNYEIVQAIIALAHALKMEVTAEGVEDQEQLALLGELGCDRFQGYFFARPLQPGRIPKFIDTRNAPMDIVAASP